MHFNRLMKGERERPTYRINSVERYGDRMYLRAAAMSLNPKTDRYYERPKKKDQVYLREIEVKQTPAFQPPQTTRSKKDFDPEQELIPKEVLVMLAYEDQNIFEFKERIGNDKLRLETDFSNFTRQLVCIIDDLKTSLMAELDLIYKGYIQRYLFLKEQANNLKRVKRQIDYQTQLSYPLTPRPSCNSRIVNELQHDIEAHIKYKAFNTITKAQKDFIMPLSKITQQIITIGKTGKAYYTPEPLQKQFNVMRQHITDWTRRLFESGNSCIAKIEEITVASQAPTVPTVESLECSIAKKIESPKSTYTSREYRFKEQQPKNPEAKGYESYRDPSPAKPNTHTQHPPVAPVVPSTSRPLYSPASSEYFGYQTPRHNLNPLPSPSPPFPPFPSAAHTISRNSKSLLVDILQKVSITPLNTVTVDSKQSLLCCTVISNKYLCIGGRDSLIYVYTFDGVKVTVLHGHKAGITTMAQIRGKTYQILASGGDHGCGSVILWDLTNWKIKTHFTPHSAAVSCIVDFNDCQLLVSCSYDKTFKVINHVTSSVLMNIPNHTNSPIVAMTLNSYSNRLVSASLDCTMNVWRVKRVRDYEGLESISHERKMEFGDGICEVVNFAHRNDIVACGTRAGKLNIVDIRTGECKGIDVCTTPIIELALIESQNQPSHPFLLECTIDEKNILLTETFNRTISKINVDNSVNLSFGCGVSPKMVFAELNKKPILFLLSQSDLLREVRVYKVDTTK